VPGGQCEQFRYGGGRAVPGRAEYAGQYTDAESGLVYMRARYYDPATAQFLTVDPLVNVTHTPYSYVNDSPLDGADPSGDCLAGGGGGGLISRLPTGGEFPFIPKKGQSLNQPRSISRESGNPVDKYGDVWQWDPIKGEWDVQTGDDHTNVGPNGNKTHGPNNTGRAPQESDSNFASIAEDYILPAVAITAVAVVVAVSLPVDAVVAVGAGLVAGIGAVASWAF